MKFYLILVSEFWFRTMFKSVIKIKDTILMSLILVLAVSEVLYYSISLKGAFSELPS